MQLRRSGAGGMNLLVTVLAGIGLAAVMAGLMAGLIKFKELISRTWAAADHGKPCLVLNTEAVKGHVIHGSRTEVLTASFDLADPGAAATARWLMAAVDAGTLRVRHGSPGKIYTATHTGTSYSDPEIVHYTFNMRPVLVEPTEPAEAPVQDPVRRA